MTVPSGLSKQKPYRSHTVVTVLSVKPMGNKCVALNIGCNQL